MSFLCAGATALSAKIRLLDDVDGDFGGLQMEADGGSESVVLSETFGVLPFSPVHVIFLVALIPCSSRCCLPFA